VPTTWQRRVRAIRPYSFNSVLTEITVKSRVAANGSLADVLAIRPALGRDGGALGRQPHGRADPCAALPHGQAHARRRAVRNPRRRPLERQHEPARAAELGTGAARPSERRPTRSLRDVDPRLGADANHRPRAPATRDRTHDRRPARAARRPGAAQGSRARQGAHGRDARAPGDAHLVERGDAQARHLDLAQGAAPRRAHPEAARPTRRWSRHEQDIPGRRRAARSVRSS